MNPTVDLMYFDAGGGHRAAALALRDVLLRQRRPWTVRMVNLTEVLDRGQLFRRLTGLAPEDLYNRRLARGCGGVSFPHPGPCATLSGAVRRIASDAGRTRLSGHDRLARDL